MRSDRCVLLLGSPVRGVACRRSGCPPGSDHGTFDDHGNPGDHGGCHDNNSGHSGTGYPRRPRRTHNDNPADIRDPHSHRTVPRKPCDVLRNGPRANRASHV